MMLVWQMAMVVVGMAQGGHVATMRSGPLSIFTGSRHGYLEKFQEAGFPLT